MKTGIHFSKSIVVGEKKFVLGTKAKPGARAIGRTRVREFGRLCVEKTVK